MNHHLLADIITLIIISPILLCLIGTVSGNHFLFMLGLLPFAIWGLLWKCIGVGPKIFLCYFDKHEYVKIEGHKFGRHDCKICTQSMLELTYTIRRTEDVFN